MSAPIFFEEVLMERILIISQLYSKFSELFRKPEKEIWTEETLNLFCALVSELDLKINCETDGVNKLLKSVEFDEILLEYTRIFLGPFKVLVPPYGSCYLENEKLLNGETTIQVKNIYLKLGLDISESWNDLPDHIVAELEFMHFLTYNYASPEDSDLNKDEVIAVEKEFFFKYFYPFATRLCSDILGKTKSNIYNKIAKIMVEFLHSEKNRILSVR